MSATTTVPVPRGTRAANRATSDVRITFDRLVRSEWTKLWTVRSTWWAAASTIAVHTGIVWLIAFVSTQNSEDLGGTANAFVLALGVMFSQLVISVLAILAVTGEYSTGMIRSTLTAAPTRTPALLAKALVVVAVSFGVGVVTTVLSWAVTFPVLGSAHRIDLSDPVNQRILAGIPLYLAAIALLAFAIGALLRHSAGALAVVLGLLLVLENVLSNIPVTFVEAISPYLPSTAGMQVVWEPSADATLGPWQGYAVLVAWGLVALTAAAVLLRRRDA